MTNEQQFSSFGADPREEIMALERVLLQTIKFDLQIDHPHDFIVSFVKSLNVAENDQKVQNMVQVAWNLANDSLCTSVCLQWESEIVAIAVIYLALKLNRVGIKNWHNRQSKHKKWWDQFVEDLDTADVEEICHQILDGVTPPDKESKASSNVSPVLRTPQTSRKSPITRLTSSSTTDRSPVRRTPPPAPANMPPVVRRTPQTILASAKNVPVSTSKKSPTSRPTSRSSAITKEDTDAVDRTVLIRESVSQVPNPPASQMLPIQGQNFYNHPPPPYIPNHAPPNVMMMQNYDARISQYQPTSNQSTTHGYHSGYQHNVSHNLRKIVQYRCLPKRLKFNIILKKKNQKFCSL